MRLVLVNGGGLSSAEVREGEKGMGKGMGKKLFVSNRSWL